MSKHPIDLVVRGAESFGRPADREDPRSPEHRARHQRVQVVGEAWQCLPLAAPINLSLIGVLLAAGLFPDCGLAPPILLGLGALLALIALARREVAGQSWPGWVLHAEAMTSAAGAAALASMAGWTSTLVVAIALVASPCARAGAPAWTHVLLAGGAAVLFGAALGAWAAAAMLGLTVASAAHTLRQSREAALRARRQRELAELEALCARLAAEIEAAQDQGAP